MAPTTAPAEVFSASEIARAAGVREDALEALVQSGRVQVPGSGYFGAAAAVRAVRLLRGSAVAEVPRDIFAPPPKALRSPGGALFASLALHTSMLALIGLFATWGLTQVTEATVVQPQTRLVFLVQPGPGGGGGGGGLKQPAPPPRAEMHEKSVLKSPVPPPKSVKAPKRDPEIKRVPPPAPPMPKPVEPPPPAKVEVPLPQVTAPVVTASNDTRDKAGVLTPTAPDSDSAGRGSGGGVGTGTGTGIGEGDGSGIGPGSGGGTGGGPYRPGSGITAPSIVREVKPDYTDDARRRNVEGDVVVEIVVRSDGSVGSVKLLQGLGYGLDQRAMDAVRQWRFSPARRYGTQVDVIVEVAVEFKLR
jgi:protein TonB